MKCNEFELNLADWIAQRLSKARAEAMAAHRDACPECACAERMERLLRSHWLDVPETSDPPDLWPDLAARIRKPVRRPVLFLRHWAFAATLTAAAVFAIFLWGRAPAPSALPFQKISHSVDDQHVVRLVSDMQKLPESDGDPSETEGAPERHAAEIILAGNTGK